MGWTQPMCAACWNERNPEYPASDAQPGYLEVCCHCGEKTRSGIYTRVDPATVPYPTSDEAA